MISTLDVLHCRIGFLLVPPCFYTTVASYCVFLLNDSEAHNLIAIVHELVDQPLERVRRVFVLVETAQKCPRTLGILVIFVFRYQSKGALLDKVCRLVEGIERNARLEIAVKRLVKALAGV